MLLTLASLGKIRLLVDQDGRPKVEAFPLAPMPSCANRFRVPLFWFERLGDRLLTASPCADPVRLVLDDRPTSYDEPFLRFKTTRRAVYDEARARHGPFAPFPVAALRASGRSSCSITTETYLVTALRCHLAPG